MAEENVSQEFRLKNVDDIRNYSVQFEMCDSKKIMIYQRARSYWVMK